MQAEGLRESSRWSERSEDHRYRVIPTRTLERVPDVPARILHPFRVLLLFPCFPVVFATLRPPATLSQPLRAARFRSVNYMNAI